MKTVFSFKSLVLSWIGIHLLTSVATAQVPTPIHFSMRDNTGSPLDRTITISGLDGPQGFFGTNIGVGGDIILRSSGSVADTNLIIGNYMITYSGLTKAQMIFWPADPTITNAADSRIQRNGMTSVFQLIQAVRAGTNISITGTNTVNLVSNPVVNNLSVAGRLGATNEIWMRDLGNGTEGYWIFRNDGTGFWLTNNQTSGWLGLSSGGTLSVSDHFSGSGDLITELNASQLTTGTVPDARFPATLPAVSGANLTKVIQDNNGLGTNTSLRGVSFPAPNVYYQQAGHGLTVNGWSIVGPSWDVDFSNPDTSAYRFFCALGGFDYETGSSHPLPLRDLLKFGGSEKIFHLFDNDAQGTRLPLDQTSTNVMYPYHAYVNSYTPFVGGSASAMKDPPQQGPEMWRRLPKPAIIYSCYFLNQNGGPGWAFVSNRVVDYNNSGIKPFLQAFGLPYIIELEGWHWTNSADVKLAARDSAGKLWWNTNTLGTDWPAGISYIHNNGIGVGHQQYIGLQTEYDPNGTPPGIFSQTISTPALTEWDIRQMISWGLGSTTNTDLLRFAPSLNTGFGYRRQQWRQVAEAVLYPGGVPAVPLNGSGVQYDFPLGSNNLAVTFEDHEIIADEQMRSCNGLVWDQNQGAPNSTGADIEGPMFAFRFAFTNWWRFAGKGHYVGQLMPTDAGAGTVEDVRGQFTTGVMMPNNHQYGYNTNIPVNWVSQLTNTYYLRVLADGLQLPVIRLYDAGRGASSGWAKPLDDGSFFVAVGNESGSPVTLGTALDAIRSPSDYTPPLGSTLGTWAFPSNRIASVIDIWNKTNFYAVVSFSNSIPAHTIRGYIVIPLAPQDSAQWDRSYWYQRDNFMRHPLLNVNELGELPWYYQAFGGGSVASVTRTATGADYPRLGVAQLGVNETTAGAGFTMNAFYANSSDLQPIDRPDLILTNWFMRWTFKLATTNNVAYWLGLVGGAAWGAVTTEPSSGIYLRWDATAETQAKFAAIVKNGATVATNYLAAANTGIWHTIQIYNDTGLTNIVRFSLDGAIPVNVTNAVGATALGPNLNMCNRASPGSAVNMLIDYYDLGIKGLTY